MKRIGGLAALAAALAVLSACAAQFGRAGEIRPDADATRVFEKEACMVSGYRWFASGSHAHPNAIIGIRKDLTLIDDTIWREQFMDARNCEELVWGVQQKAGQLHQKPFGFAILNDRGERIGVWYSIMTARTGVRMKDEKTVIIYTPDMDTYDRYERDRGD